MDSDPHSPPNRVIRFKAAAEELGISPATLRRLWKRGEGPRVLQLSPQCLGIRRRDLEAWLAERENKG